MNLHVCRLTIVALTTALVSSAAHADATGDAARLILQTWSESVVTVRIVVKERWIWEGMEDDSTEHAEETTGFVVSGDGTVVTSLSAADPEAIYSQWFDEEDGVEVRTEITSLTIIHGDGEELAAEVILRDRDLDLIFIRSKDVESTIPRPIPLNSGASAVPFEEVVQLTRFDHTLKRTCGGKLSRIEGLVEKPRRLYAIESTDSDLGSPIFTLSGELLGMTTLRQLNKSASSERGMWSNVDDLTIVVVASDDIAEAVGQLPGRE